ncbi:hypothetical protein [Halioxenophilus aromaticivorans]|uniref:Prolyl 4-hydroxylase alpha subunit Fe(2+) 2OG dioxygenase domain-containing protein n=1 Tax=Halioxenophilus aromaticivorans TaxID=1306992 RepID=A0AAV3U0Y5_9ALTE
MSANVLDNITQQDIVLHPFPHVVVKGALPLHLYEALAAAFPSKPVIKSALQDACRQEPNAKSLKRSLRHLNRGNRRVNLPAKYAVHQPQIAQVWRDFIDAHSSSAFTHRLLELFAGAIAQHYPSLLEADLRVARRGSESDADLWVDALTAVNTPHWRRGEITGPHTDHPNKLFIGLYYFRQPEDTAGGNLVLYRRLTPVTEGSVKWPNARTVEPIMQIDYEPNTLVILLNTPQSVHGVTARCRSSFHRRFVNFIVECKQLRQFAAQLPGR